MLNLFWRGVARVVSKPKVADYLIRRAMKTPFTHLPSNDDPSYMERYWLLNPYPVSSRDRKRWQFPWSIRLHLIKRADAERDIHDHPWNARTIILRGAYLEKRQGPAVEMFRDPPLYTIIRRKGDTATIKHNEYHTISEVTAGGVWTMFITGPWLGDWGFLRNGVKVWWRTYLADQEAKDKAFAEMMAKDEPYAGQTVTVTMDANFQIISKVMSLGPLAKLRTLADFDAPSDLISIKNVRASYPSLKPRELVPNNEVKFPVASNSPCDPTTNVSPLILKHVDSSTGVRIVDDLLDLGEPVPTTGQTMTHEEANALTRILLCSSCIGGCPVCDPAMMFDWSVPQ